MCRMVVAVCVAGRRMSGERGARDWRELASRRRRQSASSGARLWAARPSSPSARAARLDELRKAVRSAACARLAGWPGLPIGASGANLQKSLISGSPVGSAAGALCLRSRRTQCASAATVRRRSSQLAASEPASPRPQQRPCPAHSHLWPLGVIGAAYRAISGPSGRISRPGRSDTRAPQMGARAALCKCAPLVVIQSTPVFPCGAVYRAHHTPRQGRPRTARPLTWPAPPAATLAAPAHAHAAGQRAGRIWAPSSMLGQRRARWLRGRRAATSPSYCCSSRHRHRHCYCYEYTRP